MQNTCKCDYNIYEYSLIVYHSLKVFTTYAMFLFVFKDIDSDNPIIQVGQYIFAGEYEGKNQLKM